MIGNINKIHNQKSNFKRIDFDDKSNISIILEDFEKKEKKIHKKNAKIQNIINLKDYIMKLGMKLINNYFI
jgi:hypothetical protein